MHFDHVLDYGAAACVPLATAADLVVRFKVFLLYPFKLASLCRVWSPASWYKHIFEFLHEKEDNLDIGVGLQLQRLAWARGSEARALAWLSSAPVQGFINQLIDETLSTSLPVERRFGEVKQWETSKSTNIATASRNMIIVRFAKQREQMSQTIGAAMRKVRRAQKTRATSLQWQANPSSRPLGNCWTHSNQAARVQDSTPQKKKRRTVSGARRRGRISDAAEADAAHGDGAR